MGVMSAGVLLYPLVYTGLIKNTWAFFSIWLSVCVSEWARLTLFTTSSFIVAENSALRLSSRLAIRCTILTACSVSGYDLLTCSMSLPEVVLCWQRWVRWANLLDGRDRFSSMLSVTGGGRGGGGGGEEELVTILGASMVRLSNRGDVVDWMKREQRPRDSLLMLSIKQTHIIMNRQ